MEGVKPKFKTFANFCRGMKEKEPCFSNDGLDFPLES